MKNIDGKQSNEYFKEYYLKNRERIQARNKAKYKENRSNPEKLQRHRERSTEATRRLNLRTHLRHALRLSGFDVIVQRYVDYVDNPVVYCNGEDVTESWQKTNKKPIND